MSRNEPITPSDAKRIVENATPDFGKEQGKKAPPVIGRTPRRPGAARYYARVYTDRATTTTGGQTQGQGTRDRSTPVQGQKRRVGRILRRPESLGKEKDTKAHGPAPKPKPR